MSCADVDANVTLDYSQGGDNWCDECLSSDYQQSPIDVPLLMTFVPIKFDVDVNISFGELRRVWVDTSNNFVTVNFKSDGFLRVEGIMPNLTDIDFIFRPDG
jgi:hypothetical protein